MSTREALRAPARRLSPAATLTLATGVRLELAAEEILSFTVQEGADSALMPGNVISAAYVLTLNNMGGRWLPGGARLGERSLEGATAQLYLEVLDDGAWSRVPMGVFTVAQISAPEQKPTLKLSGSDSIATELSGAFVDGLSYPVTLAALWRHAVGQTRYVWSGTVPNGGAVIDVRPNWGEATLRQVMGYIAAAAGCFVRVDRAGTLSLERCWRGATEAEIQPSAYMTLNREFETYGPVDAVRVTPVGAQEAFTVYASGGVSTGATLSVARNPLFVAGAANVAPLAQGLLEQVAGLTLTRVEFRWRGDPAVSVGTRVRLTDTRGGTHAATVTRQTMTFDGGFSAVCACETPSTGEAGLLRAITPEGGVNAGALVGTVDGALLAAGSVTAAAIHAGAVTAEKLDVGAVTAEKIAAGAITADHLAAGAVTATSVEALVARLEQVTAQNIDTDSFSAALGHIVRAVIDRLEVGSVTADSLTASMAELIAARARTLDVDYARVKDLDADAAIITDGVAGELYIDRLAVTSAMLVSATLGELVLKGEDGNYYRLIARSDGTLSAKRATVTAGEIQAGQTSEGRTIVETSADIASLNARTVKGESAVIASIFTQALTAGSITAGQALIASATIPELYTTAVRAIGDSLDISAQSAINFSIAEAQAARLSAGSAQNAAEAAAQKAEAAEDTAASVRQWMTFDAAGLHQGKAGSTYTTLIDEVGFHISQLGEKIGSFAKRRLAVEEVRVGRVSTEQQRCVLREAGDGGMIITVEGLA